MTILNASWYEEEFALPASVIESIKVLSLNVKYLTLSVDAITLIKVDLDAEEINMTLWHPTARMRLIQFLFHTYGIDEIAKAIREKRDMLEV